MATIEETDIKIDLTLATGAHSFPVGQTLFLNQLHTAVEIIKKQKARVVDIEKEDRRGDSEFMSDLTYCHSAISVLGGRGSGKTSFLLTLKKFISDKERDLYDSLFFMPIIDPGMLEEAEYFMPTMISLICNEIWDKMDKFGKGGTGDGFDSRERDGKLRSWEESLNRLCKSLIAIDGNAYRKYMQDSIMNPEIFGQAAITDGCSGALIAKRFRTFIIQSLDVLSAMRPTGKISCLVIRIDDVDTAYDRAWTVLENIRKYLAFDQIIVITSGDTKLFELVIKNRMLDNLNFKKRAVAENLIKEQAFDIIDNVKNQYLLKIFPLQNRIMLPDAISYALEDSGGKKITVLHKTEGDRRPIPFNTLFRDAIVNWFNYSEITRSDAMKLAIFNPYTKTIPKNTREFIQFLEMITRGNTHGKIVSEFLNYCTKILPESVGAYQAESVVRHTGAVQNDEFIEFIRHLFSVFSRALDGGNTESPAERDRSAFVALALRLQPRHALCDSNNKMLLFYNAYLCRVFNDHPFYAFEYWLICLTYAFTINSLRDPFRDQFSEYFRPEAYLDGSISEYRGAMVFEMHRVMTRSREEQAKEYSIKEMRLFPAIGEPQQFWRSLFEHDSAFFNKSRWISTIKNCEGFSELKNKPLRLGFIESLFPDWRTMATHTDETTSTLLWVFTYFVEDRQSDYYYMDFQRGFSLAVEILIQCNEKEREHQEGNGEKAPVAEIKKIVKTCLERHMAEAKMRVDVSKAPHDSSPSDLLEAGNFPPNIMAVETALLNWVLNILKDQRKPKYPLEAFVKMWESTLDRFQDALPADEKCFTSFGEMMNHNALVFLLAILTNELELNGISRDPGEGVGDTPDSSLNTLIPYDPMDALERLCDLLSKQPKSHEMANVFRLWLNCPLINVFLTNDQADRLERRFSKEFIPFRYQWSFTVDVPGNPRTFYSPSGASMNGENGNPGANGGNNYYSTAFNIFCCLLTAKSEHESVGDREKQYANIMKSL